MTDHISTEAPARYEIEGIPIPSNRCRWTYADEDGYWSTACDNAFVFIDDGPCENEFRFCPYCGRPLRIADGARDAAEPSRERPGPPIVSKAEHQALLDQWNAIVRASGSATHGAAVGHVSGLRRTLEAIRDWDQARQVDTGRFGLPEAIRTLIRQFAPRS